MRGAKNFHGAVMGAMFSVICLGDWVSTQHPLCKLRALLKALPIGRVPARIAVLLPAKTAPLRCWTAPAFSLAAAKDQP
jgi:hypothetical protein